MRNRLVPAHQRLQRSTQRLGEASILPKEVLGVLRPVHAHDDAFTGSAAGRALAHAPSLLWARVTGDGAGDLLWDPSR